jgi:hypothetical protein
VRSTRRLARAIALVAALAVAALAARPAHAQPSEPVTGPPPRGEDPRAPRLGPVDVPAGRLSWVLALGSGSDGATGGLIGLGVGLFDDPERRWDLRAKVGLIRTQSVDNAPGGSWGGGDKLTYNGVLWGVDVAHAWRFWRLEPWLSLGFVRYAAALDDPASANGPAGTDRFETLALGAGLRVAVGRNSLLGVELAFTPTSRSKMTWLPSPPVLGGQSVLAAWEYRIGDATTRVVTAADGAPASPARPVRDTPGPAPASTPTPPRAAPAAAPEPVAQPSLPAPAPPPPPASPCSGEQVAAFELRRARIFLCRANPVAGGFTCAPRRDEGRFVEPAACERACRRGAETCPAPDTAEGAACARCAEECATATWLECGEPNGGTVMDGSCRLGAGRWGLEAPADRPVRCARRGELDAGSL